MITRVSLCVLVLIVCNNNDWGSAEHDTSPRVNNIYKNESVEATTLLPEDRQVATTHRPLIPGLRFPCSCKDGQCGCCTGTVLDRLRQKVCLNITYEPDDFALSTLMSINGRVLYRSSFSGKNPPPICARVPRMNFIRLCVKFSNIYFASRNIHLCIDMAANWESVTLIRWSFDCIRMGSSGVAVVPPEAGGGLPGASGETEEQVDEDYDDSAKNAVRGKKKKKSSKNQNVIFDPSLRNLIFKIPDQNLIVFREMETGDLLISYKESDVNKPVNVTIELS